MKTTEHQKRLVAAYANATLMTVEEKMAFDAVLADLATLQATEARLAEAERLLSDSAMMLRRACVKLPACQLKEQLSAFIAKNNMQGSILRDAARKERP